MTPPSTTTGPGPVVETTTGAVRGLDRGPHGLAFLGVPYAQPPVGPLRFAAPAPVDAWAGVREATAHGPTAQVQPLADVTFIPEPSLPGDDVLTLSVVTPSTNGRAPVLVWFHGGGYLAGSPASPWYDGRSFARDGVVTVVVGYRLGVEGFGVLDGAPDNRAVLDWVAALRWVRENVAAFGGDPTRVTIAGQSAGGGAVTTLLLTASARRLFRHAVVQSGAFGPVPRALVARTTRRVARSLGVACDAQGLGAVARTDVDAALRALGADDDPLAGARRVLAGAPGLAVGPVVTDDVAALHPGVGAGIPLLVGTTAHEFTAQGPDVRAALAGRSPADALRECGADADLAAEVLREHPGLDAADTVGQAVTEVLFRRPSLALARAHGPLTWGYDMRRAVPSSGLAQHCSELPFVWDVLDADGVEDSYGRPLDRPEDRLLADAMHGAWVRFVHDGDPGWPDGETRTFA